MKEYPVSFTVQSEVEDGNSDIEITSSYKYYKYVATGTGAVTIKTTGDRDTSGRLYDFTGTQLLIENDDYGSDGNFSFTYNVIEGETYYICVKLVYDSAANVGLTISFD